jgi:hypothetical protein
VKPRHAPALVVIALVAGAGLIAWLARGEFDDRRGHRPARVTTERETSSVERRPGAERAPVTVDARPTSADTEGSSSTPSAPMIDELDDEREHEDADEDDERISLRGVRGLVRDAITGAPIEGAWITWAVPTPDACETTFDELHADDFAGEMVTDAEGRFEVTRLADDAGPRPTLYAVARGHATASLRPGLRQDVIFDLQPMATLELHAPPNGRRVILEALPAERAPALDLAAASVMVVSHLAPGRWRARLAVSREWTEVTLTPGERRRLELAAPPTGEVDVRALEGFSTAFLVSDDMWSVELPLLAETPVLPAAAGRYVAVAWRGQALLDLGDVEMRPGERVQLIPPRQPLSAVSLALRWSRPPEDKEPMLHLLRIDGRDLAILDRQGDDGPYVGPAPAGRYLVFHGSLPLAELSLPAARQVQLACDPVTVALRFQTPAALREGEALRGRVALVPLAATRLPRWQQENMAWHEVEFLAGPGREPATVEVVLTGPYVLRGETDLGPFEVTVDLAATEVVVPLDE